MGSPIRSPKRVSFSENLVTEYPLKDARVKRDSDTVESQVGLRKRDVGCNHTSGIASRARSSCNLQLIEGKFFYSKKKSARCLDSETINVPIVLNSLPAMDLSSEELEVNSIMLSNGLAELENGSSHVIVSDIESPIEGDNVIVSDTESPIEGG